MNTQNGSIPANVGFPNNMNEGGTVKRAITRQHTNKDKNKQFVDNYGRTYTYTPHGCIY